MWSLLIYSCATHRSEPLLQVRRVDQALCASCFLQHWKHDLNPQRGVQTYNVVDVAEEPRGLHLEQETIVLKIQQATQEQLHKQHNQHPVSLGTII